MSDWAYNSHSYQWDYRIGVTEVIQADKVARTVSRDGITPNFFKIIAKIFGRVKTITYICNVNKG